MQRLASCELWCLQYVLESTFSSIMLQPRTTTLCDAQQLWECSRRAAHLECHSASKAQVRSSLARSAGTPHTAAVNGADELSRLSARPTMALALALLPPEAGRRNFFASRSYLPTPRYWCAASAASRENPQLQAHRRHQLRRALCADAGSDSA